ncbi:MAG: FAD-binding protein [Fibrobacterales bacterium]
MASPGTWVSWNENIQHPFKQLLCPSSEAELVSAVKANSTTIRVFGEKKSSADIAAGTDTLISLCNYTSIVAEESEKMQLTVQVGIELKTLLNEIEKRGWAIPCLPDIDVITLGGALATGTHGTGREGSLLSGYVCKMRVILASGEILELDESDERFDAFRLSVGMLGITSTVTFQCVPLYKLLVEERPVHDNEWIPNYKKLLQEYEFTRILWIPHTDHGYLITGDRRDNADGIELKKAPWWHKYRRTASMMLYKYTTAMPRLTVLANKILQKLFFTSFTRHFGTLYGATVTKSRGSTLDLAEWTIALDRFDALMKDLKKTLNSSKNRGYAHIPMDIRFIKADTTWLSYAYAQDTVTIGCVTRNAATADLYEAFSVVEEVFLRHGGRPHFAKRFKAGTQELKPLFPKWDDFIALRRELDPDGIFLNPYLEKIFK